MENCYQCYQPNCGVPTGHGYQALVDHMASEHNEDISEAEVSVFDSWKEFDFVLVLSGQGHKDKKYIEHLV